MLMAFDDAISSYGYSIVITNYEYINIRHIFNLKNLLVILIFYYHTYSYTYC